MTQKQYNYISWAAYIASLLIVFFAWGDHINWRIGSIGAYQWFPLFGLIAWVTMAEHYYLGVIRILDGKLKKPKYFKTVTGYTVLGAMLLHPGILAYQQWKFGEGLPPDSFVAYVGESLRLAVMLGSMSLFVFLSFEVFERLRQKELVQKYWHFISVAQSFAMVFIWVHAYRLGSITSSGWMETIWFIYGIALLPCFYVIHREELK